MKRSESRRTFLRTAGTAGLVAVSGCAVSLTPEAGALVFANDQGEAHTVTVDVTKTSQDNDEVQVGRDATPSTETTPIWHRTSEFTVKPLKETTERKFINEPGAFYIYAQLENGEFAGNWLGLWENDAGARGGNYIYVSILEHGAVTISILHHD